MAGAIVRAKDEIFALGRKIEVARNEELRFGQQRARMEAERARIQAFVDMCEVASRYGDAEEITVAGPLAGVKPVVAEVVPFTAERGPPRADAEWKPARLRQKRKPDGLPTVIEMVLAILEGEEAGMRPRDITRIARRKWWPDLQPAAVNAAVWKLAGRGRLEKDGHLYKLNGHAGE